jgi:hypothetical protein
VEELMLMEAIRRSMIEDSTPQEEDLTEEERRAIEQSEREANAANESREVQPAPEEAQA